MFKKIFFLVLCWLFIVGCIAKDSYTTFQTFKVYGTKTDVKITYSVQGGTKTVVAKKLPWEEHVYINGEDGRYKEWVISASSESEGEMTVQIGDEYRYHEDENGNTVETIQTNQIYATNYTKGKYATASWKQDF